MSSLRISFEFLFDEKKQLLLKLDAFCNDKPLPLALSELMTFLYYQKEAMSENETDFCYTLQYK